MVSLSLCIIVICFLYHVFIMSSHGELPWSRSLFFKSKSRLPTYQSEGLPGPSAGVLCGVLSQGSSSHGSWSSMTLRITGIWAPPHFLLERPQFSMAWDAKWSQPCSFMPRISGWDGKRLLLAVLGPPFSLANFLGLRSSSLMFSERSLESS